MLEPGQLIQGEPRRSAPLASHELRWSESVVKRHGN
jgi:hypothetical protein